MGLLVDDSPRVDAGNPEGSTGDGERRGPDRYGEYRHESERSEKGRARIPVIPAGPKNCPDVLAEQDGQETEERHVQSRKAVEDCLVRNHQVEYRQRKRKREQDYGIGGHEQSPSAPEDG